MTKDRDPGALPVVTDHEKVIDLWPSAPEMAADLETKPDVIRHWRMRVLIPATWWGRVARAAQERGYPVTYESLESGASRVTRDYKRRRKAERKAERQISKAAARERKREAAAAAREAKRKAAKPKRKKSKRARNGRRTASASAAA